MQHRFSLILLLLTLTIGLIFTAQSCTISEPKTVPRCTQSDSIVTFPIDLLSRTFFEEGVYWIYEDSLNPSVIDSFYVYESKIDTAHLGAKWEFPCFAFRRIWYNSKLGYSYIFQYTKQSIEHEVSFDDEAFFVHLLSDPSTPIVAKFWMQGNTYASENLFHKTHFIDTLVVGRQQFYNVLHSISKTSHDVFRESYWDVEKGLVKFVDFNGVTWLLVRTNL